jgi:hypothetical protein
MFSLVGLLFLFRFGTLPAQGGPVSFKAEAHQAALESSARSMPALDGAGTGENAQLDLPLLYGTGPIVGPMRAAYRPSDWVSLVARRLSFDHHPLGQAAIWLSEIPVQMDAHIPDRVGLRVTLHGF